MAERNKKEGEYRKDIDHASINSLHKPKNWGFATPLPFTRKTGTQRKSPPVRGKFSVSDSTLHVFCDIKIIVNPNPFHP